MKIYTYNTQTGLWEALPEQTLDPVNNFIKAPVYHLSLFAILYIPEPAKDIQAEVNFAPDTLNLKSSSKFVSVYIELPKEFDVRNIDIESVKISQVDGENIEPIFAEEKPTEIGDVDEDGIEDLMVKFSREKLKEILPTGKVKLTVEGFIAETIREANQSEKRGRPRMSLRATKRSVAVSSESEIASVPDLIEDLLPPHNAKQENKLKFSGSAILRVIEPGKAELISKEGGEVKSPTGAELKFQPGALEEETLIVVQVKEKLTEAQEKAVKLQKLKALSDAFEFSPAYTHLSKPVTISLNYSTTNKPAKLYLWDETSGEWKLIKEDEKGDGVIVAEVYQLGIYQVMYVEEEASPLHTPDATFKLGEVYVFPNPAKFGQTPTIHIECGIADSIEISLYDLAGELVYKEQISGSAVKQTSGKYCYEYTCDVSNIASGVYIYCVVAEKQGEKPIKVIKKLGIIK